MTTTRVTQRIAAPPSAVYAALLDPEAVRRWMVPDGMRSEIHAFEPVAGGRFRISLTYDAPDRVGKTAAQTDTFGGTFAELVPNRRVVQLTAFESPDPALRTEMRISYELEAVDGGTLVTGTHAGLPESVSAADNELGWRMSLGKLAALVEGR